MALPPVMHISVVQQQIANVWPSQTLAGLLVVLVLQDLAVWFGLGLFFLCCGSEQILTCENLIISTQTKFAHTWGGCMSGGLGLA